jgi:hypothetical protein
MLFIGQKRSRENTALAAEPCCASDSNCAKRSTAPTGMREFLTRTTTPTGWPLLFNHLARDTFCAGKVTSSYAAAQLLILGYNCFAQENRREPIDIEAIERSPGRKVDSFLREWVMLSRSQNLVARGEIIAARDEVLAFLKTDDPGTNP